MRKSHLSIPSYHIALSSDRMHENVFILLGAGGEIGGGTAKQMAQWGAKLALIDIHEGRLNEVLAKCAEIGLPSENIYSIVGDVMKQEVVTSFVEGAVQAFGTVNFLVNISSLVYFNSRWISAFATKLDKYKHRLHNYVVNFVQCWHGDLACVINAHNCCLITYWSKYLCSSWTWWARSASRASTAARWRTYSGAWTATSRRPSWWRKHVCPIWKKPKDRSSTCPAFLGQDQ